LFNFRIQASVDVSSERIMSSTALSGLDECLISPGCDGSG